MGEALLSVSRSYVRHLQRSRALQADRPIGRTSGPEGAASLDTAVVTQPAPPLSKTADRLNSTAKRLRLLTPRTEWLADLKQCTELVREQSARKLDASSRAVGLDRRRQWRLDGSVWRSGRSGRTEDRGDRVRRIESIDGDRLLMLTDPRYGEERGRMGPRPFPDLRTSIVRNHEGVAEYSEHLGGAPELESHWHSSRAKTKRELFERVGGCGTTEATTITIVARTAKTPP